MGKAKVYAERVCEQKLKTIRLRSGLALEFMPNLINLVKISRVFLLLPPIQNLTYLFCCDQHNDLFRIPLVLIDDLSKVLQAYTSF